MKEINKKMTDRMAWLKIILPGLWITSGFFEPVTPVINRKDFLSKKIHFS